MNIFFVSLGCDKNLVDSEVMLGLLDAKGYQIVDDETLADVMVINTCCFIHDAKEESIQTILDMARYKEEGRLKALVVTGCLAQRYKQEIIDEIPEVDVVLGTTSYDKIVEAVEEALEGKSEVELADINALPLPETKRLVTTGGHYAYLKIAEGCDKCCTYCIIPKVRGHYRSVPMDNLIKQAQHLTENGVKELILVAQETTLYGTDLYGRKSLPELLEKLSEVEELRWIRILYCYPEEITDELIDAMKRLPKVCHYLDIPIQHGVDTILKKMGRRTDRAQLTRMVGKLRTEIPDIALRTTLITGFPGETEEDFEEMKEFVRQMRFERLGVFTYSQEEDTPAAEMEDQIPEEIKEERRDIIMAMQQEIAFENNESRIGEEMDVMIEGYLPDDDIYVGRSYMDAPDVDGFVFLSTSWHLETGDYVRARIVQAQGYDLIGEVIEEEDEDELTK